MPARTRGKDAIFMPSYVTGINPAMLRWARDRAGLSMAAVAAKIGKSTDIIENWEAGTTAPTYGQLEKLAYQLYRRPLAIFFLPNPPEEPTPKNAFRTLPDFEIENLQPDTLYNLRYALSMQVALKELTDGINPSRRLIFEDLKISPKRILSGMPQRVRDYLNIDLDVQFSFGSHDAALKYWRNALQEVGIYIFKRSFKQREVSGFSIYDKDFPIILVNNTTSKARQIFTIFHELGHILFGETGITKVDDSYIDFLRGAPREIEQYCNQFAAEFLVPSNSFEEYIKENPDVDYISQLAQLYWVSREVILRKFYDAGKVTKSYYLDKTGDWNKEYLINRTARKRGGDYYATQATYLGTNYLKLAFTKYYQGRINIEQLADYLNVKRSSIPGLEPYIYSEVE